ncbi:MAG: DUF4145 domain-containing protein [Phycisphaerales bacterium]|nr:DUF4145 domain-containing protein [Phycisphaerales bacterium]
MSGKKITYIEDLPTVLKKASEKPSVDAMNIMNGISAQCPHCGTVSLFTQVVQGSMFDAIVNKPKTERSIIKGKCAACCEIVVVSSRQIECGLGTGYYRCELELLWPRAVRPSRAPAELPNGPRQDYDEAREVLSLSTNASAVLARRCLQAILRSKLNIRKGDLQSEIAEAIKSIEISKTCREAIDHIRKFGNIGAHPNKDMADTVLNVTHEEASYTLDVIEMLFDELYYTPAQFSSMSASLARKQIKK